MLRHFSRIFFFQIFNLGKIFENFDQKCQKMAKKWFFGKKIMFLTFLVKIVKYIASFNNLKKKKSRS